MNAKASQPASDDAAKTFEQGLADLEGIVHRLEEGELPLAQSLADYAEGVALLKHCFELLESAERKIELLRGIAVDGEPTTEPFDDTALSLEEKSQARSQRRSRGD
jgi:exodeoxyribonuclease VII small subunit